jgi:hypothetical protein
LYHLRQGGITQTFHDEIATELEKKQQKLIKRPFAETEKFAVFIAIKIGRSSFHRQA